MSWEMKEIIEIQHQPSVLQETMAVDHSTLKSLNSSLTSTTLEAAAAAVTEAVT
jgi:hypothetical protein